MQSFRSEPPDSITCSDDIDQGREMTVPVAQLEGLDAAGSGLYGVADRVGSDLGERRLTVLPPDLVQRLEPRG